MVIFSLFALPSAPSILSADFGKLSDEVKAVCEAGADLIHCDIMDGHFVPNMTMGPMIIEAVKKAATVPLDIHFMVEDISFFVDTGAEDLAVADPVFGNLLFDGRFTGADTVLLFIAGDEEAGAVALAVHQFVPGQAQLDAFVDFGVGVVGPSELLHDLVRETDGAFEFALKLVGVDIDFSDPVSHCSALLLACLAFDDEAQRVEFDEAVGVFLVVDFVFFESAVLGVEE
jgi:hypothetical protein